MLGRHKRALRRLGRLFEAQKVEKTYLAVVRGRPQGDHGRIDLPLAKRSREGRGWWMKTSPEGRPAITDWRLLAAGDGLSLLRLQPRTGRTHQIRVHCAALGCPVLGDPIYGPRDTDDPDAGGEGAGASGSGAVGAGDAPGLHLHARAIRLPLHQNQAPLRVSAPIPELFRVTCGAHGLALDEA